MRKSRNNSRLIAILLTLVMLLGLFPLSALAEGEPDGYITISVDANTLGMGFLYEPMRIPFYEGESYFAATARFLGAGNYKGSGAISAIRLPDSSITPSIPTDILEWILSDMDDSLYIEAEESDIIGVGRIDEDFLSSCDYDFVNEEFYGMFALSGWMYTVDNEFSMLGTNAHYPTDGDVCRWQFTLYGAGADLGFADMWGDAPYEAADKDALTAAVGAINADANKDILLTDADVQDAYDAAYSVLTDLTASQESTDDALDTLEAALDALDDDDDDPDPSEYQAVIVETGEYYNDFADALKAIEDGETIKLLDNVNHTERIVINGKSITFDVNGFTLDVKAAVPITSAAVDITDGAIDLLDSTEAGDGEFNVEVSSGGGHAVWVRDANSSATVTNVTTAAGTGSYAIYAAEGASVTVKGDAISAGFAVYALAGSTVTVNGDVTAAGSYGVYAAADSTVTIGGDITGAGSYTVYALAGSTVTIDGSVAAEGSYAVYATGADTTVSIDGDVTSTYSYAYGVYAISGSTVIVSGSVTLSGSSAYYAVYAQSGATVTVNDDVTGSGNSVVSSSGADSVVTINGNVKGGTSYSVVAGSGGEAIIYGDVTTAAFSSYGVYAGSGGIITVAGNVYATGGAGVYATSTATAATSIILIEGNVTGTTYGASAGINSMITIEGEITVPASGVYVRVNTTDKTKVNGAALYSKPGYLTYASGTSAVYVKDTSGAEAGDPRVVVITLGGSYKTSYVKGDDFDVEGMIINAEKNDGTSITIDLDDDELSFSGYDLDTAGRYAVAVSFEDGSATYDIIVNSTGPKAAIGTTNYDTLADALAAVEDGETIKLLEDIIHDDRIVVTGTMDDFREITIDVNGFILEVRTAVSNTTPAVDVTYGALYLDDSKGGELNVFTTTLGHAVWARIGGNVTVTNATALGYTSSAYGAYATDGGNVYIKGNSTGSGYGAYASGVSTDGETASTITVGGDVIQTINTMNLSNGAYAVNGGKITVGGSVFTSGSNGAYTSGANSSIVVAGNVTSRGGTASVTKNGVYAYGENSFVTVGGNVYGPDYGVSANTGAIVTVNGDVIGNGSGVYGSGAVVINGNITVPGTGISSSGNVTVEGNVSGATGISASGTITVKGDIVATNTGVSASGNSNITLEKNVTAGATGVSASGANAFVNVTGDVTVTNANGVGISVSNGGIVVLEGEIMSDGVYARVNARVNAGSTAADAVDKIKADGVSFSTMPGYLGYVAGPSAVWVKGTSTEVPITPIVTSIALSGDYKVRYIAGEAFDASGMVISAVKSDASRAVIPITGDEKLQFDGYDTETPAGVHVVTVSYEDGTANFSITVVSNDLKVEIVDTDGNVKKQYADFSDAIAEVDSGDTIRLLKDVHHIGQVEIRGTSEERKSIIFDVGEYTLTLECIGIYEDALLVYYATVAFVSNGGEFNIIGSGSNSFGIGAYNGSEVMVSNVTSGYYAVTSNSESVIMVEKNIYSHPVSDSNNATTFYGAYANNASVAVGGDIIVDVVKPRGTTYGVYVINETGSVTVSGSIIIDAENIMSGTVYGVYSGSGAAFNVDGDIIIEGDVASIYGAYSAGANANATVKGDIGINATTASASTSNVYGLYSGSAGSVNVEGNVDVDVTVSAATANVAGAYATAANSRVILSGDLTVAADITATTANVYGAHALTNAFIEIKGLLTAPSDDAYIRVNSEIMKKEDGVPYTSNPGNLAYIDATTIVWVKDWGSDKEPETSTVRSIALSGNQKNLYFIGDKLNTEGLIITATYGDGIKVQIPPSDEAVEYSGFDSTGAGKPVITVTYQGATATYSITVMDMGSWDGAGTESDPYLINDLNDLMLLHRIVGNLESGVSGQKAGYSFRDTHFLMTADITLPDDWTAIGGLSHGNGNNSSDNSRNMLPFSGTFDGGGHTLTFPANSDSLFAKTREAHLKNLKIYGPSFKTSAILNSYFVDYGPNSSYSYSPGFFPQFLIDIDNVTLLAGSKTQGAGFTPDGFASGINHIYIRNSLVEKGVECNTASFAGSLNGLIENCVSYATIRGGSYVGGIVGRKDQSMGPCQVINCAFYGGIIATGNYVGGIVGGGYNSSSAPGTPLVSIWNCLVTGTVTGANSVGGIYGGEGGAMGGYDNSYGYIMNNVFVGKVNLTAGTNIGGIIGYMRSLTKINVIENNFYTDDCGAVRGIGAVPTVSTDYTAPDNPLNAGTQAASSAELTDGTVVDLLNNGRWFMLAATHTAGINPFTARVGNLENWIQGENYPIHDADADTDIDLSADASLYSLGLYEPATAGLAKGDDGIYRAEVENYISTIMLQVTALSSTATVTLNGNAIHNNQPTEYLPVEEGKNTFIIVITSEDGSATSEHTVVITRKDEQDDISDPVTVTLTLVGSTRAAAGVDLSGNDPGGYNGAEYEVWIQTKSYTMERGSKVYDLLVRALREEGLNYRIGSFDNYLEAIWSPSDYELAEFTNGPRSGWMYYIGSPNNHSSLGLGEQEIFDGDSIVWHYVNDYSYEIEDWFDEENFPALGDGSLWSLWLNAIEIGG